MANNDFDVDFDFEEEYGFDPKAFLSNEEYDENIDLTEYSDEELGLRAEEAEEEVPEDYPAEEDDEELPYAPLEDFRQDDFQDEALDGESEVEPVQDANYEQEEPAYMEDPEEEDEEPVKKPKKPKKVREPKPKKEFHTPGFLVKFYDMYFAPVFDKTLQEEPADPNNPRRRRRKSPNQIFKEYYLPPILVCLCLVMVFTFIIGTVSDVIVKHLDDKEKAQVQQQESSDAAQMAEQELQRVMREAAALATEYDYDGAIGVLEGYSDPANPDILAQKAEYSTVKNSLVAHSDPSMIPNLSFHALINDLSRALADRDLGGKYNRNFVSTGEFTNILNALYNNGFVLVDFDSFISSSMGVDGNQMYFDIPIYLPADKKPVMLTETLVNYFPYMIDTNKDGVIDCGAGFASKLVLQNGEVKAEYVTADGQTLIGDYDFVPILETFIKSHPDFVYQGARATLAVTGSEGVFGYRTNTSYIASKSQSFYDQEVAGAKEIAAALREKGYRIASFTYKNGSYKEMTAQQIQEDLTEWTKQIATPVLGTVDTFIFAQESNISDYTGMVFKMLYTSGFRIFVSKGDQPWAEVNSTYVRQNRLMVTGNTMQWHKKQFENIFDCAAILDVNARGNVPND